MVPTAPLFALVSMDVEEVLTAPRSPWQNPFAERLIGSVRRECLDHVIVLSGAHLLRVLSEYLEYYHETRAHQSLDGNSPVPREVKPPERGPVVGSPVLGGLHHDYFWQAMECACQDQAQLPNYH